MPADESLVGKRAAEGAHEVVLVQQVSGENRKVEVAVGVTDLGVDKVERRLPEYVVEFEIVIADVVVLDAEVDSVVKLIPGTDRGGERGHIGRACAHSGRGGRAVEFVDPGLRHTNAAEYLPRIGDVPVDAGFEALAVRFADILQYGDVGADQCRELLVLDVDIEESQVGRETIIEERRLDAGFVVPGELGLVSDISVCGIEGLESTRLVSARG